MIDVKIETDMINEMTTPRKLKAKWGCELPQDLGVFHGMDSFTNHIGADFRQIPKKGDLIRYTNTIVDPQHRPEGESRVGLCLSVYDSKKNKYGTILMDGEVWTFSSSPGSPAIAWIEVIDE
jgi:hypothetical protein